MKGKLSRLTQSCLTILISTGFALSLIASTALAAQVGADVSRRETIVGKPVLLKIQIANASDHEEPDLPQIDGLEIESTGPPATSTRILSINGRRSQTQSLTYTYRVIPEREGTFTIPPIRITADGLTQITKAIPIVVNQGEPGDRLFVEIKGKEKDNAVYVGEPLRLTLRIWVRPFEDSQWGVRLGEAEIWNRIAAQSNWGPFEETIEEMAERRRRPGGRPVIRKDSEGQQHEYLLYEIDAVIYPDRPGEIDGDDVRIVMDYPTKLGRAPSPFSGRGSSLFGDDDLFGSSLLDDSFFEGFGSFGGGLTVTESEPIAASADIDAVLVKPIPEAGRPANYRGAVGRYRIVTEAEPTEVRAGEPVTLRIGIEGDGPMDRLRAPPLQDQKDLKNKFKVPEDSLAGVVNGSSKVFSTSIRPRDENVSEIPAIEFSFFDPDEEKFVTVSSDPIPIDVAPADVLSLDSIVSNNRAARGTTQSGEPEPAANIWPMFAGEAALTDKQPARILPSEAIAGLVIPPLAALLALLVRMRGLASKLVTARRRFQNELEQAEDEADVAAALQRYLQHQFQIDTGRRAPSQTVGQLRASGRTDLALRVERIYHRAARPSSIDTDPAALDRLKSETVSIADDFESKRSRLTSAAFNHLSDSAAILLFAAVAIAATEATAATTASMSLSRAQQRQLLHEATQIDEGLSAEAKRHQWQTSIDKLETLVQSGVVNDRLYFNLATLYHRDGQLGVAIANYRRALKIEPSRTMYREYRDRAEAELGTLATEAFSPAETLRPLFRIVPANAIGVASLISWSLAWLVIALRCLSFKLPWKTTSGVMLAISLVTAGLYVAAVAPLTRDDVAVVVADQIELRRSDGKQFDTVTEQSEMEGHLVQVLDQRGGWTKVKLESGSEGWLPQSQLARIDAVHPPESTNDT